MAVHLSGLNSGLDTEAIVKELMSAQRLKVKKVENKKTKLEWKDEKWKELNQKIYKLYTGELSKLKLQSSYGVKKVTTSDSSKATITAGSTTPAGIHTVEINKVASAQFVTGAALKKENLSMDPSEISSSTKLVDLGITQNTTFTLTTGDTNQKTSTLEITDSTTISDLSKWAKESGVNLTYDSKNQRFFASSIETGTMNQFSLTSQGTNVNGSTALQMLGLGEITQDGTDVGVSFIKASDCVVTYNGAEFTSSTNSITINGLTINAIEVTTSPIRVNVTNDTESAYNTIKNFITEYNNVLKEINSKLYADSAKGYDILTEEEREAMTEEQIEKWENKIKDSLLRNDSSLSNVRSALISIQTMRVEVDGKSYSLKDFGIGTINYTEKGILHIDGDSSDTDSAANKDLLMQALNSNPDLVMEVFTGIAKQLSEKLNEKMASSSLSSALTFYNDKQISSEKTALENDIKKWEKRLEEMEKKWYSKFTAMEVAMSKFNAQSNYIFSLFSN